jgi:hypothetical protein
MRSRCLATALALIPVPPAVAENGVTPYAAHCAKCHLNAELLARRVKGATPEERTVNLSKLLETHQAPDAAIRKAIVDHLVKLAAP